MVLFRMLWSMGNNWIYTIIVTYPANTMRWPKVGLMLGQRRRHWPIGPTTAQHWADASCLLGRLQVYIMYIGLIVVIYTKLSAVLA